VDIVRFPFKLNDVIDDEPLTRATTLLGAERPRNRKTLLINNALARPRHIPRGPLFSGRRNHCLTLIFALSNSTSVPRLFPLRSGFCPNVLGKHALDRERESVRLFFGDLTVR